MTLLFKQKHVPHILREKWPWKGQTRRLWKGKTRAKVGSLHWLSTHMLRKDKRFARVLITGVHIEPFRETRRISKSDVAAEGYVSRAEYVKSFTAINGRLPPDDEPVTVIDYIWVGDKSERGKVRAVQCPACAEFQELMPTESEPFCESCGHDFFGENGCPCHPRPKEEGT